MLERLIIAGSGGQGIMLLGKILAEAALREGNQVTWLPAYGPEVRGGAAHCTVIISEEEIGSPYVQAADSLILMNALSFARFRQRVRQGGLVVVNTSLVEKTSDRIWGGPFTDIAISLGNIRVANIVALGYYLAKRKICRIESALAAIASAAPPDKRHLIKVNQTALLKGTELVR